MSKLQMHLICLCFVISKVVPTYLIFSQCLSLVWFKINFPNLSRYREEREEHFVVQISLSLSLQIAFPRRFHTSFSFTAVYSYHQKQTRSTTFRKERCVRLCLRIIVFFFVRYTKLASQSLFLVEVKRERTTTKLEEGARLWETSEA